MKTLLFLFLSICATTFASGEKYYLSICALFRNEARFLREWIEYHHMLGVEHFYLFNHLSEDNYLEVLEPYIDSGLVELYDMPIEVNGVVHFGQYVQIPIYHRILTEKEKETFWLAIIDTDEFIVPKHHDSIPAFLKNYEAYGGVVLNWQQFGTSDVAQVPENRLLIEMLTKKAPKKDIRNHLTKSIVIPSRVPTMYSPHFASYFTPYFPVDEKKKRVDLYKTTRKVRVDKIQVNHYFARDDAFFYGEKARRYKDWYPDRVVQIDPKYNSVTDTSILRFVPELKKRMNLE